MSGAAGLDVSGAVGLDVPGAIGSDVSIIICGSIGGVIEIQTAITKDCQ